jgi:hypothetical protein
LQQQAQGQEQLQELQHQGRTAADVLERHIAVAGIAAEPTGNTAGA